MEASPPSSSSSLTSSTSCTTSSPWPLSSHSSTCVSLPTIKSLAGTFNPPEPAKWAVNVTLSLNCIYRFRTFLLDSELHRAERGLSNQEKQRSLGPRDTPQVAHRLDQNKVSIFLPHDSSPCVYSAASGSCFKLYLMIVSLFQWGDDSDSDSTPSGDDTPHHLGMSIFDFISRFPIEILIRQRGT